MTERDMPKNEEGWKERLSPEQFRVLRERGTEPAFTGKYVNFHEDGTYVCAACGDPLFAAGTKFDSGSGWPSFDRAIKGSVVYRKDDSAGTERTEVMCARCESHLGHVFPDGPTDTGKRYCMNSLSLEHTKDTQTEKSDMHNESLSKEL